MTGSNWTTYSFYWVKSLTYTSCFPFIIALLSQFLIPHLPLQIPLTSAVLFTLSLFSLPQHLCSSYSLLVSGSSSTLFMPFQHPSSSYSTSPVFPHPSPGSSYSTSPFFPHPSAFSSPFLSTVSSYLSITYASQTLLVCLLLLLTYNLFLYDVKEFLKVLRLL